MRRRVTFEKHNLLGDASHLGRFDVVFLRNVLIYFDPDTRRRVLDRLAPALATDGFLVLGGTETARGLTDDFVQDSGNRGLWRPAPPVRDVAGTDSGRPGRLGRAMRPVSMATSGGRP